MDGKKKVLLSSILMISILAAVAASLVSTGRAMVPGREMSSVTLYDPILLHQLTDLNPADFLDKCEADCQVGEKSIPVTGLMPTADPRRELRPTPEPALPEGCQADTDPDFLNQVLELVNEERVNRGFPALRIDPRLAEAARKHSQEMACRNYFSHSSLDGASAFDRMAAEYYPMEFAAENIYAGNLKYNSPQMVFNGWMNSPSHRAAMLDPIFDEVGLGYYYNPKTYLGGFTTMDLGKQTGLELEPDKLEIFR